jgi:hypothetical protein
MCDGGTWDVANIEVGSKLYISRMVSGYYTEPYSVEVVTPLLERDGVKGFMVYVETNLGNYFDCISDNTLVADSLDKLAVLCKKYLK